MAYISDSENRQKRNTFRQLLKYPFLKRYFSAIQFFLSVGDANKQFYKSYGVPDSKILEMHFPIDVEAYRKAFQNKQQLRQQARSRFHIQENEIVASVVGKLVSWKNQDHFLYALQLLEKEGIIIKDDQVQDFPKRFWDPLKELGL